MLTKPSKAKPVKTIKGYRLQANYGGKQYKRRFIQNENLAYQLQRKVNERIYHLKLGYLKIPNGISFADYIFFNLDDSDNTSIGISDDNNFLFPLEKKVKLSQLIEEYVELCKVEKPISSQKTIKIHIRHLQKFLKHHKVENPNIKDISVQFFYKYKAFREKQKVLGDTVNKELSTFRAMFELAKDHEYIDENVVCKVKKYARKKFRDRFRTMDEVEELIQLGGYNEQEIKSMKRYRYLLMHEIEELLSLAKDHWLYPILIICAYTGMRRCEVMGLQWQDVNFKNKTLFAKSAKQSRTEDITSREIPMREEVFHVLKKQMKDRKSRWVFTGKNNKRLTVDQMKAFQKLLKNTKFEGLGYHMFRHSFASNLANSGVDARTIDSLMGHTTIEARKRYEHLLKNTKVNALQTLEAISCL